MSSALAMILAAGMTAPGDVPKEAMEEIEQGLDVRGGSGREPTFMQRKPVMPD
jgi:hypothetical protein